jgi:hypothetical protein
MTMTVRAGEECPDEVFNGGTSGWSPSAFASDSDSYEKTATVVCPEDVDLSLTKVAVDPIIGPGQLAEFIVTVTNSGSLAATVFLFDDPSPDAGLDWIADLGNFDDCTEPTEDEFVCDGVVPGNGSISARFFALVDTGECGLTLSNEASVELANVIQPAQGVRDSAGASVQVLCRQAPPPSATPTPPAPGLVQPAPRQPGVVSPPPKPPSSPPVGVGPEVITGDSGITVAQSVSGWQAALLALTVAGTLFGAYAGYRRLR